VVNAGIQNEFSIKCGCACWSFLSYHPFAADPVPLVIFALGGDAGFSSS
jgi:hypothetical protein